VCTVKLDAWRKAMEESGRFGDTKMSFRSAVDDPLAGPHIRVHEFDVVGLEFDVVGLL
jgi:hypothetical protein